MVVFLDLEDEAEPPEQLQGHWRHHDRAYAGAMRRLDITSRDTDGRDELHMERENPNKKKAVTEALACYPYDHHHSCQRCRHEMVANQ